MKWTSNSFGKIAVIGMAGHIQNPAIWSSFGRTSKPGENASLFSQTRN